MQHQSRQKFISVPSKYLIEMKIKVKHVNYNIIYSRFEANFGQQTVLFTFKCGGLAEVQHGHQPRITRKPNRMEIIV